MDFQLVSVSMTLNDTNDHIARSYTI